MDRTIYLQHYRICLTSDGAPREINTHGAAITYEAVDERSREPVDLRLIPLESIDPGVSEPEWQKLMGSVPYPWTCASVKGITRDDIR